MRAPAGGGGGGKERGRKAKELMRKKREEDRGKKDEERRSAGYPIPPCHRERAVPAAETWRLKVGRNFLMYVGESVGRSGLRSSYDRPVQVVTCRFRHSRAPTRSRPYISESLQWLLSFALRSSRDFHVFTSRCTPPLPRALLPESGTRRRTSTNFSRTTSRATIESGSRAAARRITRAR